MILNIVLLSLVGLIPANAIHRRMTREQRLDIFKTDDVDKVPYYELVSPIIERNTRAAEVEVRVKAFGNDVKLYLNPTEGVLAGYDTPVWEVAKGSPKPKFTIVKDALFKLKSRLLEDAEKGATVVVTEKPDNTMSIRGVSLAHNLEIHPVPSATTPPPSRIRIPNRIGRSLNETSESDNGKHWHIALPIAEVAENRTFADSQLKSSKRSKRAAIDVVYPQVLIIVHYDYFVKLGKDISKALSYLLNFWNGVDLLYRGLEHPKFRFNIAGFVFAKDNEALDYMSQNMWTKEKLDVSTARKKMGKFMYSVRDVFPFESYDVAVTMTDHTLCTKEASKINCAILGVSTVEGACGFYPHQGDVFATFILKDNSGYGGILTAAHELGHSFGVAHDDRQHCKEGDEVHIMSTITTSGEKSSDWSDCSLQDFEVFLSSEKSLCLKNKPKSDTSVPRNLPGKFITVDEQCQARGYLRVYKVKDENICMQLSCLKETIETEDGSIMHHFSQGAPAVEGTTCDKGKICLHNQCRFQEL